MHRCSAFPRGFHRLRRRHRGTRGPQRFSAFRTRLSDVLGFVFLVLIGIGTRIGIGRFAY